MQGHFYQTLWTIIFLVVSCLNRSVLSDIKTIIIQNSRLHKENFSLSKQHTRSGVLSYLLGAFSGRD